jgi:hypothetical protein
VTAGGGGRGATTTTVVIVRRPLFTHPSPSGGAALVQRSANAAGCVVAAVECAKVLFPPVLFLCVQRLSSLL